MDICRKELSQVFDHHVPLVTLHRCADLQRCPANIHNHTVESVDTFSQELCWWNSKMDLHPY